MKTNNIFKKVFLFLGILGVGIATSCSDDDPQLSDLTGILSFGFTDEIAKDYTFSVDNSTFVIKNNDSLPYEFDVSSLTAQFSTISGTTVTVNGTAQVSGVTANNFSSPVTYVVTAEDGVTTKSYTVSLDVAQVNPEGVAWNLSNPSAFDALYDTQSYFKLGGKHYMILGKFYQAENKLFSSTNGASWTEETPTGDFPAGFLHNVVVRDNVAYVIGFVDPTGFGSDLSPDLYESTDGIAWTKTVDALSVPGGFGATPIGRINTPAFSLNNTIYVVGGNTLVFGNPTRGRPEGEIYYPPSGVFANTLTSTDGVAFTQSADYNIAPARAHAGSFIKDDKMFIVGGIGLEGKPLADIWSSTDGVTWTLVSDGAFSARLKTSVVIYDDKLWMFGGALADGTCTSEILVSEDDGVTWVSAEQDQALPDNFVARCNSKVVIDDDGNIIIMGGETTELVEQGIEFSVVSDVWIGKLNKLD